MKYFANLALLGSLLLAAPASAETFDGSYALDYPEVSFNVGMAFYFAGTGFAVSDDCSLADDAAACFAEGESSLLAFIEGLNLDEETSATLMADIEAFYDELRAGLLELETLLPDEMALDRWWVLLSSVMSYSDSDDTVGLVGIIDPETGELLMGGASWPWIGWDSTWVCGADAFTVVSGDLDPGDYTGGGDYILQEAGVCSVLGALIVIDFGLFGEWGAAPL